MNKTRKERMESVNELLKTTGNCGRKFFHHKNNYSKFIMDKNNKLWYIDKWSGEKIYAHYYRWIWNHKITEGGTLKSMLKDLKDFIWLGTRISRGHMEYPDWMCNGDVWAYKEDMKIVIAKAEELGIIVVGRDSQGQVK